MPRTNARYERLAERFPIAVSYQARSCLAISRTGSYAAPMQAVDGFLSADGRWEIIWDAGRRRMSLKNPHGKEVAEASHTFIFRIARVGATEPPIALESPFPGIHLRDLQPNAEYVSHVSVRRRDGSETRPVEHRIKTNAKGGILKA